MSDRVGGNREDGRATFFAWKDRGGGNNGRGLVYLRCNSGMHRHSGLEPLIRVVDLNPNLNGGGVGIGGGADHRDLAFHFVFAIWLSESRALAHFDRGCFRLRNVDARDNSRNIHDRDHRRTRVRHFSDIERPVGDNARNRAHDPRISHLRLL